MPGTAAPIILNFMDVVGSISGKMLPTGNVRDVINGIEVTCIDVAMPMIMMRAKDFGLTGYRRQGGDQSEQGAVRQDRADPPQGREMMGFGDVSDKVIPKVGLLSPPRDGGTITSRYLTPHALHAAHAVTGAVCVSTACALEGSIAHELAKPEDANPRTIWIEHPSGQVDVLLHTTGKGRRHGRRRRYVAHRAPDHEGRGAGAAEGLQRRLALPSSSGRPPTPNLILRSRA